jgi:hypothetical protein
MPSSMRHPAHPAYRGPFITAGCDGSSGADATHPSFCFDAPNRMRGVESRVRGFSPHPKLIPMRIRPADAAGALKFA